MIDFFEEGKKRRFMSADKAEDELMELFERHVDSAPTDFHVKFWEGYRWNEPPVKQKAMKK